MKKLLILLLLLPTFLSASIMPHDDEIGAINSHEISKAFYQEYSVTWLDNYVSENYKRQFSKMYSKELLALLPLENVIVSAKDKTIKLKDTSKSILIVISLDDNGKILDFKKVKSEH